MSHDFNLDDVYEKLVHMHEGNGVIVRNFPNYTERLKDLVLDYIGDCLHAKDHWTRRTDKLSQKWHDELDKISK